MDFTTSARHGSVSRKIWKWTIFLLATAASLAVSADALAQTAPANRLITAAVDENDRTVLRGNTYPLAHAEYDRGAAPASLPLHRMILVLKRSQEQEATLDALLEQQQEKGSPNYHQWLTPAQFGQQFGPGDEDIQAITSWLASHGFEVAGVSNGRTLIEFSGTAGQVAGALHTEIHKYHVNGEDHWANASDPQIPAALVPAVAGVLTLHNFPRKAMNHVGGVATRSKKTGKAVPVAPDPSMGSFFTLPAAGGCGVQAADCYAVSPSDFLTIYNVYPLWNAATPIKGTNQTIAIVAESNIDTSDVTSFRNYFGLPNPPNLTVTVSGPDPMKNGAETEALLDTEWAGAIAPNAMINLVVAESTEVSLGADLAAIYAVDNNLAPVLNVSFGICELFLGTAGNQFYNQLWQQAAAQGTTVDVATGDSGAAVCDRGEGPAPAPAVFGLTVSGFSTTPYNVAIGGTDFNDLTDASNYWNINNSAPAYNPAALPTASAKSFVPETTWDVSCTNPVFGTLLGFSPDAETNCNNPQLQGFVQADGGSGGMSNCISSDGQNVASCTGGYGKPIWQVGAGVPNDMARDVPDASLYAAIGGPSGSFYIICEADLIPPGFTSCDPQDPGTEFIMIGGTSASAPAFSAIMALVNEQTKSAQGNANYILYKLAAQQPTAFHDVPAGGTIAMPCAKGSPDCIVNNPADIYGVLSGFSTTAGYDLATGLGSVNANNFVTLWDKVTTQGSATTLTLTPSPVKTTHGQPVNFTIGVTAAKAGGGTPTGNVSLIANTGPSGQSGVQGFVLASGSASGTTSALPGGNYTVIAQYPGDGIFGPSTSTPPISVQVTAEASKVQLLYELFNPATGLQTNPNATTAQYGSLAILRTNVTSQAGDACANNAPGDLACPTGSVTVTNNGAALDAGTYNLNSLGYAEDQTVQLPGGTNNLSATYSGDSSFLGNTGNSTITITQAPTSTLLVTPSDQVLFGASVPVTASVVGVGLGAGPTGQVTFFTGATPLGAPTPLTNSMSGSLNSSPRAQATITTTQLLLGDNSITAQYSGDGNYSASTSSAITVDVQIPTNCSVSSSNLMIARGSSVTFTATVSPTEAGGPGPTGLMDFIYNGDFTLGMVTLTNGQAQMTTNSLPGGSVSIRAVYLSDQNYTSCFNTLTETVNFLPTTTSIMTSNPSVQQGQNVTFTAVVAPVQPGGPALTGTVNFTAATSTGARDPLAVNVAVANGQAVLTTSNLPANTQSVMAAYSGDFNYSSSSGSVAQAVVVPDFSMAANPATITVLQPGSTGSTVITFTAMNGLTGTFNLVPQCNGLPSESSCSTMQSSIMFSSTVTTATAKLIVSTTAPSSAPPAVRIRPTRSGTAAVIAFSLLTLAWILRNRRRPRRVQIAFSVFSVLALLAFAACGGGGGGGGGGGNLGTLPGLDQSSTVTFMLGNTSHTLAIPINVE